MLFAGVSSGESDGPRTGTHDREGREYRSLHRSGDDTHIREHSSEVDILLPGALADTPILGTRLMMGRPVRSVGSLG